MVDDQTIPAIPTTYGGTNFRSRLEARWAAAFDILGWRWTYEPLDGSGYVPDFLIAGPHPFLIEVKPAVTEDDYRAPVAKITAGIGSNWDHDVVVVGASIDARLSHEPTIGLAVDFLAGPDDHNTGRAYWATCTTCVSLGILIEGQWGLMRPCGHTAPAHNHTARPKIEGLWAAAGNAVQWRAAS